MIYLVAGTRPNFMKIAPIRRALDGRGVVTRMIHTGQHASAQMSEVFFHDLGMAPPDVTLSDVGGSHAEATAAALVGVERDLMAHRPSVVVVVGDVTSTLAAALAAAKLGVPVAHVEAGLRARDWTMPEEINRVLTDRLADLLLIPSEDARANLTAEGIDPERIVFVGNVMIDSVKYALGRPTDAIERLGLRRGQYAIATLHRPANVDTLEGLRGVTAALTSLAAELPVVFPMHPRTLARAEALGLLGGLRAVSGLHIVEPQGYDDFVTLMGHARLVATDSGGIQEETTALGVPCLTMRGGTERPITVTMGTNVIVGLDPARITDETRRILAGQAKQGRVPEGWDGRAGERVADALMAFLGGSPPAKTAGPRA